MSYTRWIHASLFAVALSACGHAGMPSTSTTVAQQAQGESGPRTRSLRSVFLAEAQRAPERFPTGHVVVELLPCEPWAEAAEDTCDLSTLVARSLP